jgi:hypothetical protein
MITITATAKASGLSRLLLVLALLVTVIGMSHLGHVSGAIYLLTASQLFAASAITNRRN